MAGHAFGSWEALQAHLRRWLREVADRRCHGTTGETPASRFAAEAAQFGPWTDRPPFGMGRELHRTVSADCAVTLATNHYSVPWRLVGRRLRVELANGRVRIYDGAQRVADHVQCAGRHARIVERTHFEGMTRRGEVAAPGVLARPLDAYERLAGGAF